jgi:hypothetical protein
MGSPSVFMTLLLQQLRKHRLAPLQGKRKGNIYIYENEKELSKDGEHFPVGSTKHFSTQREWNNCR